jgi:hypothetical protein
MGRGSTSSTLALAAQIGCGGFWRTKRARETEMAKKTVFVSDLRGKAIDEGKVAKIRITFDDARRGAYEVDATADEAAELGRKGRQVARRGRKPKAA